VNAYLSFSKGGAFKPHWDIHDSLVVQVHGNKRWRVWDAQVPYPIEIADRLSVNASAHDQEVEMGPGDVLFIPRGDPHSAAVSSGHSVHLTIALFSRTGLNLLDQLRDQAAKDPIFRIDLPRHSSGQDSAAHFAGAYEIDNNRANVRIAAIGERITMHILEHLAASFEMWVPPDVGRSARDYWASGKRSNWYGERY